MGGAGGVPHLLPFEAVLFNYTFLYYYIHMISFEYIRVRADLLRVYTCSKCDYTYHRRIVQAYLVRRWNALTAHHTAPPDTITAILHEVDTEALAL